ncbi:clathrin interactor EPSIN 2 isoform X2 [Telopea speciosissima]|uniref:clathrin interactor EPSIN 2 isoform X2 n=1 Tax=Telopea speciosissima TaxID=54955 RepID=UPI001CC7240D|nr:clathrin interactor EPSIN 2 isoform X2 [Telopea speciosissima]
MKKALGQTVRDLKREVNKKVLKIPGIEQKVLDATSNEPWGPHGSHLADIAQATRNYHEYQMIMAVIWKRINDTGKNWRHVYKSLIILEYLVAHGSERVIDEIREHAYQISTLADFQYIDSSGRDQGNNVRKKSQSLVTLVNDKERIEEARQKAAANRDKFRGTSSAGGMYKPGSYSSTGGYGDRYDDDRYGSRDEERNGYGKEREREWGYKDDDRYSRGGDSYSRDEDRYGRDSDDRHSKDGYRDDDYRGRSRSNDDYQYGSRSRSSDGDRDRAYEDDGRYSSRSSGARADDYSQGGRQLERKYSEQNIGAPPSYEEVVSDARVPVHDERDGETEAAPVPKASSPPQSAVQTQVTAVPDTTAPSANQVVDGFDEFDPRGSVSSSVSAAPSSAAPPNASNAEMDLLGSLTESFTSNQLAIVPASSSTTDFGAGSHINSGSEATFEALSQASTALTQPIEDPFGDSPFKAIPTPNSIPAQQQTYAPIASFQSTMTQSSEAIQPLGPKTETVSGFDFGDTFPGITYTPSGSNVQDSSTSQQFLPTELSSANQDTDILANILPPSGMTAPVASQSAFPGSTGTPALPSSDVHGNFFPQSGSIVPVTSHAAFQAPTGSPSVQHAQPGSNVYGNFLPQSGSTAPVASQATFQAPTGPPTQPSSGNFFAQSGSTPQVTSQPAFQAPTGPPTQPNNGNFYAQFGSTAPVASQPALGPSAHPSGDFLGNLLPQAGPTVQVASQAAALPAPTPKAQTTMNKFEPKSTVWADTLSRGLVNLNISGSKINPLADIGIDFDAINRKEKRMEKPAANTVTSTITMGKAMGSGSGIGRAGASALAAPPNPMMGSGMGMGMGMGMGGGGGGGGMGMGMNAPGGGMGMNAPGAGMGMGGGYGGGVMNQPMGMGMGMGMNMGMGMGMGMNMGMGQGTQMRPPTGLPPGSTMPAGYNPMMGMGGHAPQQSYGGYR